MLEAGKPPEPIFDAKIEMIDGSLKPKTEPMFKIRHYAGSVWYHIKGMREKSFEELPMPLNQLLKRSENEFVQELLRFRFEKIMKGKKEKEGSVHGAKEMATTHRAPAAEVATTHRAKETSSADTKKTTVGTQFKLSMDELFNTIKASDTHYVRCIKPNKEKSKGQWDADMVSEQLLSSGIIEAVQIRKHGYSQRMPINDFMSEFVLAICERVDDRLDVTGRRKYAMFTNGPGSRKTPPSRDPLLCEAFCREVCDLPKFEGKLRDYAKVGTNLVFYRSELEVKLKEHISEIKSEPRFKATRTRPTEKRCADKVIIDFFLRHSKSQPQPGMVRQRLDRARDLRKALRAHREALLDAVRHGWGAEGYQRLTETEHQYAADERLGWADIFVKVDGTDALAEATKRPKRRMEVLPRGVPFPAGDLDAIDGSTSFDDDSLDQGRVSFIYEENKQHNRFWALIASKFYTANSRGQRPAFRVLGPMRLAYNALWTALNKKEQHFESLELFYPEEVRPTSEIAATRLRHPLNPTAFDPLGCSEPCVRPILTGQGASAVYPQLGELDRSTWTVAIEDLERRGPFFKDSEYFATSDGEPGKAILTIMNLQVAAEKGNELVEDVACRLRELEVAEAKSRLEYAERLLEEMHQRERNGAKYKYPLISRKEVKPVRVAPAVRDALEVWLTKEREAARAAKAEADQALREWKQTLKAARAARAEVKEATAAEPATRAEAETKAADLEQQARAPVESALVKRCQELERLLQKERAAAIQRRESSSFLVIFWRGAKHRRDLARAEEIALEKAQKERKRLLARAARALERRADSHKASKRGAAERLRKLAARAQLQKLLGRALTAAFELDAVALERVSAELHDRSLSYALSYTQSYKQRAECAARYNPTKKEAIDIGDPASPTKEIPLDDAAAHKVQVDLSYGQKRLTQRDELQKLLQDLCACLGRPPTASTPSSHFFSPRGPSVAATPPAALWPQSSEIVGRVLGLSKLGLSRLGLSEDRSSTAEPPHAQTPRASWRVRTTHPPRADATSLTSEDASIFRVDRYERFVELKDPPFGKHRRSTVLKEYVLDDFLQDGLHSDTSFGLAAEKYLEGSMATMEQVAELLRRIEAKVMEIDPRVEVPSTRKLDVRAAQKMLEQCRRLKAEATTEAERLATEQAERLATEQEEARAAEEKARRKAAVVKMQGATRGHLARKELKRKKREAATKKMQAISRGHSVRRLLASEAASEAAQAEAQAEDAAQAAAQAEAEAAEAVAAAKAVEAEVAADAAIDAVADAEAEAAEAEAEAAAEAAMDVVVNHAEEQLAPKALMAEFNQAAPPAPAEGEDEEPLSRSSAAVSALVASADASAVSGEAPVLSPSPDLPPPGTTPAATATEAEEVVATDKVLEAADVDEEGALTDEVTAPTSERDSCQVFISFRQTEARPEAEAIEEQLKKRSIRVFRSGDQAVGSDLEEMVTSAIDEAKLVVFMGTRTYGHKTNSYSTSQEMKFARDEEAKGKKVRSLKHVLRALAYP